MLFYELHESWKALFIGSGNHSLPLSYFCKAGRSQRAKEKTDYALASTRTRLCRRCAGLDWHLC